MKTQKTPRSQNNIEMKNKVRDVTLPDFKLLHKATVTKTLWCWHKKKAHISMDRTESSEMNPHLKLSLPKTKFPYQVYDYSLYPKPYSLSYNL